MQARSDSITIHIIHVWSHLSADASQDHCTRLRMHQYALWMLSIWLCIASNLALLERSIRNVKQPNCRQHIRGRLKLTNSGNAHSSTTRNSVHTSAQGSPSLNPALSSATDLLRVVSYGGVFQDAFCSFPLGAHGPDHKRSQRMSKPTGHIPGTYFP